MRNRALVIGIAALLLAGIAAFVGLGQKPSALRLSDAVAAVHEVDGTAAIAISVTIANDGGPDRLLSVTSPEAKLAMLHGEEDLTGLPIPAGTGASLSADGAHVMLMGIPGDLTPGRLFPITLTFANAGAMAVKATLIEGAAAMTMDHSGHGAMAMDAAPVALPAGQEPSLTLRAEPTETGWRILSEVTNFRFAPDAMDGAHVPGEGHGHLYIGGIKIMRVTAPEVEVGALPQGEHKVRVVLNTNDHRAYLSGGRPMSAEVVVTAR